MSATGQVKAGDHALTASGASVVSSVAAVLSGATDDYRLGFRSYRTQTNRTPAAQVLIHLDLDLLVSVVRRTRIRRLDPGRWQCRPSARVRPRTARGPRPTTSGFRDELGPRREAAIACLAPRRRTRGRSPRNAGRVCRPGAAQFGPTRLPCASPPTGRQRVRSESPSGIWSRSSGSRRSVGSCIGSLRRGLDHRTTGDRLRSEPARRGGSRTTSAQMPSGTEIGRQVDEWRREERQDTGETRTSDIAEPTHPPAPPDHQHCSTISTSQAADAPTVRASGSSSCTRSSTKPSRNRAAEDHHDDTAG